MLQTLGEAELAEQCRQGSRTAYQQLYERYAGWLMAVCVRYAANREWAEDLLQDTFLKAFRSFRQFTYRGEGSLKAWLTRIAVNESVEFLRKQARLSAVELTDNLPEVADEACDWDRIPPERLQRFIEDLPVGYRTVFNLYVLEEKSHKEIAAMLGITEKTSSSQYYRARMLLMKNIKDYMRSEL